MKKKEKKYIQTGLGRPSGPAQSKTRPSPKPKPDPLARLPYPSSPARSPSTATTGPTVVVVF